MTADVPASLPEHRFELEVTRDELDELGHVNNARYLDFLERARTTWYREVDLVARAAGDGSGPLGTVVVNVNIDYRRECLAGDRLTIETRPLRAGNRSFAVRQRVHRPDGTLAAEAVVTSVVMDLGERRAIPLADTARALFDVGRGDPET